MIAQLKGEIARVEADYVVVDVHGVGYKVHLPLSVMAQLPSVGGEVELFIYTSVKEDSITLFGFLEDGEQRLFEHLLTVSSVGPKLALNILSVLPVEQVVDAISSEEHRMLSRVPGVGTKTAQRIVLELKEKVSAWSWVPATGAAAGVGRSTAEDAVEGLVGLGYTRADAKTAVEAALKDVASREDAGGIVRAALRQLSKG